LTSADVLVLTGGTLALSDTSVIQNSFLQTGGVLSGAGDLSIAGLFVWTGGTLQGPGRTLAAGGLAITGNAAKALDGRTLENAAAAIWTGTGNITASNNAVFHNLAEGTFTVQNDALFQAAGTGLPSTFENDGTLQKSQSGGTTTLDLQF